MPSYLKGNTYPQPRLDRRWIIAYENLDPTVLTAFAASLKPAQVSDLVENIKNYLLFEITFGQRNAAVLQLLRLPHLDLNSLQALVYLSTPLETLFPQVATALLAHPAASESLVASLFEEALYITGSRDVVSAVALQCGWYYPTAWALVRTERTIPTVRHTMALELTATLRQLLTGRSEVFRSTVNALASTWTGSLDDLLETAEGVLV